MIWSLETKSINDISKLNRTEFDHIYTDNIIIPCPKGVLLTNDFKDGKRIRYDNCRFDNYPKKISNGKIFNEEDYLRLKDSYILTAEKLVNAKKDLSIMHPLPRVNEISVAIDDDPRACYFKQVLYGKYMRMALILKLLEIN